MSAADGMTRYRAFLGLLHGTQAAALPTAQWRTLPDFLIVGAQRSGTTTLYRTLTSHPAVLFPRLTKGVHHFDVQAHRGSSWYRAGFPLRSRVEHLSRRLGERVVVGEAAPYYGFHPEVPGRIAETVPEARAVMILRDPVTRAWSQFHHERARGFEPLTDFDAALEAEPARLAGAPTVLAGRPGLHPAHRHHSYVARGRYDEQLRRLWDALGEDRVLILYTEHLERDPGPTLDLLQDFLGIGRRRLVPGRWNGRGHGPVPAAAARTIRAATAASDEWLVEHLSVPPPWVDVR